MSSIYTRGGYALPSSSLDFKTGSWRTKKPVHLHAAAPCHHACPAGEDAQAYLALVEERRFREAWETLVSANPMPTVTGRVCHHPCETACNRSKMDSAIAIHNVERFLGEQALMRGWDYPMSPLPANAPAVAVVGAGPAGCSAAYHLRRQGIKVTLFEAVEDRREDLVETTEGIVVEFEPDRLVVRFRGYEPIHRPNWGRLVAVFASGCQGIHG